MNVLGLACYYHDASAALVRDGAIVAAAHEERFNRRKTSSDFPIGALNACLQLADLTLDDVDAVAFYEKPFLKFERVILSHLRAWPSSLPIFRATLPPWLRDRLVLPLTLRHDHGFRGDVHFVEHHEAHAASAFLASPFEEAAVLVADGVGEWATTTLGQGDAGGIRLLEEIRFPDSLGLLYTAVTTWLGFEPLRGEGKVMALADYGEPRFLEQFTEFCHLRRDGSFHLDPAFFGIVEGERMYGRRFVETFGPPRAPGSEITALHQDVAASLQRFLEEALLRTARHLHGRVPGSRLCLAGGCCLNITATSRIAEETPFSELFIQPAAGDAGGSLGAALALHHAVTGRRGPPMATACLGPAYGIEAVRRALRSREVAFREVPEADLPALVAGWIARGRIVGWFQGRMEFGPRALGHRSILADPRVPDMKDVLNARVKHREPFRPYGVSVLMEEVGTFLEFDRASPYMLQVARVRPGFGERIPAAVHVNGTTRLQTVRAGEEPLYHALIAAFRDLTGVPMVINTSFNDNNEPIVCTPSDAVDCYLRSEMDALVLGTCVVERHPEG